MSMTMTMNEEIKREIKQHVENLNQYTKGSLGYENIIIRIRFLVQQLHLSTDIINNILVDR